MGAVVATTAPTFELLIVGRVLQGVVISTMFLTYSLMRDVYPPRVLPLAASISTTGVGIFSVGMPFLVGWLLDTWGWRGLFGFDVLWILILGPLLVLTTAESPVRVRSRVDYLGGALLSTGIAGVLGAVSFVRTLPGTITLGLLVVGAVLMAAFARISLRRAEPLVDLRVFTHRPVLLAAVTAAAAYSATAVSWTFALTDVLGRPPGSDADNPEFAPGELRVRVLYLDDDPAAVAREIRLREKEWVDAGRGSEHAGAEAILFSAPVRTIVPFQDW